MRLATFIRQNLERILQEWEDFAVTLHPLAESTQKKLRDHAEQMLVVICDDLETSQGEHESIEKSKGNAPNGEADTAAEVHAEDRMQSGFSIEELMAEYRALRSSVLRLWQREIKQTDELAMQDMVRFNEAIDQAMSESVARFSELMRDSQNVFLAILGHDVRNPLGAITMGAHLLSHAPDLPGKLDTVAERILASAGRIKGLLNDLIDFSTGNLGRAMPIAPEPMDFAPECLQIVDEMRAYHPDRQIEVELSGDLHVRWDLARINQALSNLVGNAIQHGDADHPVWIAVKGGEDIVVSVKNMGARIDPDRLRVVFDPGRRFSIRSASERKTGDGSHLGLGLYIARQIVQSHRGTIQVRSSDADGTVFTVTLPREAHAERSDDIPPHLP